MTILRDDFLPALGIREHRHAFGCISHLISEITEFDRLEDVVPRALSCLSPIFEVNSIAIIDTRNSVLNELVWFHRNTTASRVQDTLKAAREAYLEQVDPSESFNDEPRSQRLIPLEMKGLSDAKLGEHNRLVLPLFVSHGLNFGILQVESLNPLQDDETAKTFLNLFATHLALGIDRIANLKTQRKLLAQQYSSNIKLSQLEQQRVEAIAANSAKSSFLANMSHEIRTPLGIILGFTELLGTGDISQIDRGVFQNSIRKNGQLLAKLIDDLLDLAKIEEGKIEMEYKSFSLAELLGDIEATFAGRAREKGLFFEIARDENVVDELTSDPFRLKQILLNIVNNALKFTDEGGITLRVHQALPKVGYANSTDRIVSFEIKDTGLGITTEEETGLFQPFKQATTSTARKYGGTGLGLILSRRLANALGGDVILRQSSPGIGSVFEISIAHLSSIVLKDDGDHKIDIFEDVEEIGPEWNTLAGASILIADDALDNLLLFSTILRAHGALVDTAVNGFEAVEKALRNTYDILLLDLQMPVKDGFTAAGELRSLGYTKPILALTAMAMAEERAKAIESGCTDHLSKPVNAEHLIQKIVKLARPQDLSH